MDANAPWTRIKDLLGRDPTRIEEELAIHLIRTGHLYLVEGVIFGERPFTCSIGALTPVADLILEKWNSMEQTHQDALRSQLQSLLWRIRDREVSEPASFRTVGKDLDVETILRGIKLASCVWGGARQKAKATHTGCAAELSSLGGSDEGSTAPANRA